MALQSLRESICPLVNIFLAFVSDSKIGRTSGQIDSLNDWRAKGIPDYLAILYSDLGEMGWNQMNSASYDLGRYWVSAWELAGKPVLPE